MFSLEIYEFSEAATGGVLWKNLFLKISQYSFYLKETPTQDFSSEYCEIFKNTYFKEYLLTAASNFLKQLQSNHEQLLLYWLYD